MRRRQFATLGMVGAGLLAFATVSRAQQPQKLRASGGFGTADRPDLQRR